MLTNYHAQFLLDKEKDSQTARLRYRIKWDNNKKIVSFSVGYRIEVNKWSLDTQRCVINTTHGKKKIPASTINKKIQNFETAFEKVVTHFDKNNIIPTVSDFRDHFNQEIGNNTDFKKNFFEIFDEFISEESKLNLWTKSTNAKFNTVKNHLIKFNPHLDFDFFDESGLFDYQIFLQNDLNFKNSTIIKHFSFLKWFLRWAQNKKYNTKEDFRNFKPKLKTTKKKIIFLTQKELKQLQDFIIPDDKSYLDKVRDIFIFQCYSGLRYSDVANLKRSDVKENHIEITTVKTADSLIIELNNYTKAILEKYKNRTFKNNLALPVISNQKMNDYIKELAELAEINEPIRETYYKGNKRIDEVTPKYALLGTHAGRRTFICNALSLGIPPQVVMKWTGHSDYKAMKPYIDIADEIKVNAMEKFNLL
ncbi:site-specific integrase [Empedobacter stercoris]|uniref:site-specific integrase n=1 Tax=Empedobacter stercoris TaxID=1628248 RepID=UPI00050A173D|nr:site-specific integrase [Empedobacter stercoris]UWX66171.1 site-specific integrase [Empedobacter stercoris]